MKATSYEKIYIEDADFAKFCHEVLVLTIVKNEEWLKGIYIAYQSNISAEMLTSMVRLNEILK